MKIKKTFMYITIIFFILFILLIGIFVINKYNNKNKTEIIEYIPEQEITEEQLRKTNILLYFYDYEEDKLSTEIRQIDSRSLLENPAKTLVENLIIGPQNDKLKQLISPNTKLISIELIKGILYINFSEEFIKEKNIELDKITESISKTIFQLNEVEEIEILINGEKINI